MIILIAIALIFAVIIAWHEDDKFNAFMATFLCTTMVFVFMFLAVQFIGNVKNRKLVSNVYPIKIVSLQDNSQINGSVSGGLFVTRGIVGENEYFSFYREHEDGTYSLHKFPAAQSVIVPDSTPQTAHIIVTDQHYSCKSNWWLLCGDQPAFFAHAEFHVPANSITSDFVLDAE